MRPEPTASRILRRFGRVLALAFVALYGVVLAQNLVDDPSRAYIALLAVVGLAAVGAVAAWFDDSTGGGLLVLAGVAMAVCVGVFAERNATSAILYLSAPFLLAGLLVLLAKALSVRHDAGESEA
ncbi:MAG: hypothetical protein ABSG55_06860 [Dehalococcoidia bacterium]